MKKNLLLFISFIFFFSDYSILAQDIKPINNLVNEITKQGNNFKLFHKIQNYRGTIYKINSAFNYPLKIGDFEEYITTDTTTFMGLIGLKYSVVKEVIGDTIMPNGLTYKIIKWYKCANSSNEPPQYEYQRMDSTGNVFIYYNKKDNLLYDFSKNVGDIYPSQYSGYSWYVANKYLVTGFGNQYAAIDLQLRDQINDTTVRQETLADNFGLIYYKGDINISSKLPEGNFWGGIINDTTYGTLLAKYQKINWSEFYPLHVGDFWKYEGNQGAFNTTEYIRVIRDTLLPNNEIYHVVDDKEFGAPYSGENIYYDRLDSSNGKILQWNPLDSLEYPKYIFSTCLGDTFNVFNNYNGEYYYMINLKNTDYINFFTFPLITSGYIYFKKGFGLYIESGEGYSKQLVGAVIAGKVYGDTSITGIEKLINKPSSGFKLYQNYPNPFNPSTSINYYIPHYSHIVIKVYDLLGRVVQTLVDTDKPAGEYTVKFSSMNLASGIYFYSLKSNGYLLTKKLLILK